MISNLNVIIVYEIHEDIKLLKSSTFMVTKSTLNKVFMVLVYIGYNFGKTITAKEQNVELSEITRNFGSR